MARIPNVSCEKLVDAMKEFDREVLHKRDWKNWEQNRVHRYAVQYNGHLYPVKKIISIATGLPVAKFHGGREANTYVEQRCGHALRIVSHPSRSKTMQPDIEP